MRKILIFCLLAMLVFAFVSCGSKDITNEEVQNIRDILAGDWKIADDYLDRYEDSGISKDFTITILDDGTWYYYKDDDSYVSELADYYIDYAYDDKYSVDFTFSNTSDILSCIYYEETDSLFQSEETTFTIQIYDIMERK
jgi:hypothetical protein